MKGLAVGATDVGILVGTVLGVMEGCVDRISVGAVLGVIEGGALAVPFFFE